MGAIASQITSLTIVYSTVYPDADQRTHQSSASLAFLCGIHRWPLNSPPKGPVTQKMFLLMTSSCRFCKRYDGSRLYFQLPVHVRRPLPVGWCGISVGKLSYMLHINKKGFIPGEEIVINATVTNRTTFGMRGSTIKLIQVRNAMKTICASLRSCRLNRLFVANITKLRNKHYICMWNNLMWAVVGVHFVFAQFSF